MNDYLQVIKRKQLLGLYLNTLLRAVSKSLVRIFVAIHLIKLGYSLNAVILEFMALKSIVWPLASFVAEQLCTKFGTKQTISIGTIAHIFHMLLLIWWPKIMLKSLGMKKKKIDSLGSNRM
jgi:hypothetical protein